MFWNKKKNKDKKKMNDIKAMNHIVIFMHAEKPKMLDDLSENVILP